MPFLVTDLLRGTDCLCELIIKIKTGLYKHCYHVYNYSWMVWQK